MQATMELGDGESREMGPDDPIMIPMRFFHTLMSALEFARMVAHAVDNSDTLSSAEVRKAMRGHGLAPIDLVTPEVAEVSSAFAPDEGEEAEVEIKTPEPAHG